MDYLISIFSLLLALSILKLVVLAIIFYGWADLMIIVLFVAIVFAYLGYVCWQDCRARSFNEAAGVEAGCCCGCGHEENQQVVPDRECGRAPETETEDRE